MAHLSQQTCSADSLCSDSDWLFCYRWLLLEFKREFPLEDVCSLWEVGPVHCVDTVTTATCTKGCLCLFAAAVDVSLHSRLWHVCGRVLAAAAAGDPDGAADFRAAHAGQEGGMTKQLCP